MYAPLKYYQIRNDRRRTQKRHKGAAAIFGSKSLISSFSNNPLPSKIAHLEEGKSKLWVDFKFANLATLWCGSGNPGSLIPV